jgi:hypothetical protein
MFNVISLVMFILFYFFVLTIKANNVIQLNDTTFEYELERNYYMLVYFNAAWSHESNFFKKQFYKLENLLETKKKILLAEVSSKNTVTNNKYNIKTYPSIVFINKDKYFLYNGEIDGLSIKEWIER